MLITTALLFAAILHATWNVLLKRGKEPLLDAAIISLFTIPIGAVGLALVPPPMLESWPYLAAGVVIHNLYFLALAYSYQHADLGPSYSIMRGLPPLLISVGSAVLLGEHLPPLVWLGIACTSMGLIFLGKKSHWPTSQGLLFSLIAALLIASYTIVDGVGTRLSGSVLGYLFTLQLLMSVVFACGVACWKSRSLKHRLQENWPNGAGGAVLSMIAYGVMLWAVTKIPMGMALALRETSVLFANIMAVMFLREPFRKRIIIPAVGIVIGIALLKLAAI